MTEPRAPTLRARTRRGWDGGAGYAREVLRVPLVRNAYSLVGATLATSGLGVVFWIVAARSYSTAEVGIDAALISAMVFLSRFAQLNLASAFNRFVPTAGTRTRRLVLLGYLASATLAAVAGTVFVLGVRVWTPKLSILGDQHLRAAWFVTATIIWTLFVLQDSVLTGLGEAPWVLVENAVYGVAKLVALIVVSTWARGAGVFAAWTVPLVLLVIPVNRLLFGRLIPARRDRPDAAVSARSVGRYVSIDFAASMFVSATSGLMPLLVLASMGARASAYVYLSWSIAYTVHFLSENVGMSLITEGSRDPEHLIDYARTTLTHSLRIVVPLSAAIALGAPLVLRAFGTDYSAHATRLLQLLTLSAIPNAVVVTYLSVARVRRHMGVIVAITAVQCVSVLGLTIVLLHVVGLDGVGLAWLGSLTAIAGVLLAGEFRTVWLPYVRPAVLRSRDGRARARGAAQRHSVRIAATRVREVLRESGLEARGWAPNGPALAGVDVYTVPLRRLIVPTDEIPTDAVLKIAANVTGAASLGRRRAALDVVRIDSPPGWHALVPVPLAAGATGEWTLETRVPGVDARGAVDEPGVVDRLLDDLARRMRALYAATRGSAVVDDVRFSALVEEPLSATVAFATSRLRERADANSIARARAELAGQLAGRTLTTAVVHGNLWLGNVLRIPGAAVVSGIVDWTFVTPGIPVVDIVHLVCSTRALEERREIGAIMCELLERDDWPEREARLLERVPGTGEITSRAAVLLAWLQHLGGKGSGAFESDVWMTHNVHQVLEHV